MPRHSGDRPAIKQPTHVAPAGGHSGYTNREQDYARECLEKKVEHLKSTARKPLDPQFLIPHCEHDRLKGASTRRNDEAVQSPRSKQ